jgi:uncharacterized membrane protein YdjX (TVP38/TMEM64 family)
MSLKLSWKLLPLVFLTCLLGELCMVWWLSYRLPKFQEVGFPTNFEKAKTLATVLSGYLSTNYYDILLFQVCSFIFLQTWCIPGTFAFNLLGGALFGIWVGFPVCLACNVLGATFAYLLSKIFLKDLLISRFKNQFESIRSTVEEHKKDLFFYMTSTRIFPGSPNWLMNLSFPHISNIPLHYFVLSIAIGLIPWNFITCKAGEIIYQYQSKDEVITFSTYIKLMLLALGCLVPPIAKKLYNRREQQKEQKYSAVPTKNKE